MSLRNLLTGLGVGAAAMYLLDPACGRARQARLRDRIARMQRDTEETVHLVCRDMSNRTQGIMAEFQAMVTPDYPNDALIEARIRAELGHVASRARPITVDVEQGIVTLCGSAPAEEIDAIAMCVESVRGVRKVHNQLEAATNRQPGQRPGPRRLDLFQRRWSPATRFLVGTGCGAAVMTVLRRRAPLSFLLGSVATGLTAVRLADRAGCPASWAELADRQLMRATGTTTETNESAAGQTSSKSSPERTPAAAQQATNSA